MSTMSPNDAFERIIGKDRLSFNGLLARAIAKAKKQRILKTFPDRVCVAMHFSRADLCGWQDWKRLKRNFDAVRRTYATTTRPTKRKIWLPGGHHIWVTVTLLDTMLLAATGKRSLADLGEMLDISKIVLPPGTIKNMDRLREEDPQLFEDYAIRDALIAARWVVETRRFFSEELGVTGLKTPPTLSAAAVCLLRRIYANDHRTIDAFLGYERINRKRVVTSYARDVWPFAADCYHGGRNEAFEVGYSDPGIESITDVDIRSAYSTAMALIRPPNWANVKFTKDIGELAVIDDRLSFGRVRFRFPDATRFPSLPVRAEKGRGLIYLLEGVSYCTGPELVVAINQGAEIEVKQGVIIPWADDFRPFAEFSRRITEIRGRYPKAR